MGAYCKHWKNPSYCDICKRERVRITMVPTVSIRPYKNEDGNFSVELHAHGLRTAAASEKLADLLTAFMAGKEITTN